MSTPRAQTSRRTALALAVSVPFALAGCDLDPPTAAPSQEPSTTAPLPDSEVVASAREAILVGVALIEAVRAEHGARRMGFAPLLRLHAAHLTVLDDGSEDPSVPAPLVGSTPALARGQVDASEDALAVTLADAAGRAASGDLARALASMSAAVLQRVVV